MSHAKKKPAGQRRSELKQRFEQLMTQVQTTRIHFRNVVENNGDGIVVVNPAGEILYLNPAAEVLLHRARTDCVGEKWPYNVSPESELEMLLPNPGQEDRYVEMRAVETEWEGEPASMISIRDVTARKAAEEAVRELNEQLEEQVAYRTSQLELVNQELEAFNYAVSHDLRTPLARIDGYASLLLSEMAGRLAPDNEHFLHRIRASVAQMVALTDGLLQLSRLNSRPIEYSEFNLSALAQSIFETLQQDAPTRKVDFSVEPDLWVTADYVLLRAALENLMSNAWKFTQQSETARIHVGQLADDEVSVFYVRDSGVGFSMSDADQLFSAFQRLHVDPAFPGTGIGLTTVRRIIHRHGGRVWAESMPKKGATFYFSIPTVPR